MISQETITLLNNLSNKFETADFIVGDPSWFMHQVKSQPDKEATAFVAAALSYGNRQQFMQKIQIIMNFADNHIDNYIRSGKYKSDFQERDNRSFYRLYSYSMMHEFFEVFQSILINYGSLGEFIADKASTAMEALEMITTYFAQRGISTIIPKSTSSACKRLCMFLRWMVRDSSPVDLGLWRNIIDKRSLIIPLDTHVLSEANNLNLIKSHSATMTTAIRLTDILKEVFPDDPMRGDFALFGYGVNK